MKLTVYDKSNSHPALTYKGKRIITVCRDGSMYLSRILSRELSLHAGNRLCIARDEDRPKDWYMFVSDDGNGFTIWNDPRCARFSNSFIAGMILDAAKVEKCAGFMCVFSRRTGDGASSSPPDTPEPGTSTLSDLAGIPDQFSVSGFLSSSFWESAALLP